jgi:surface-adhesin protein E
MNRLISSRLFFVSVVLLLSIFITNQKIFGENWIFLGNTEDGSMQFLDKDSITKVSPSVKRIWKKTITPLEVQLKIREQAGLPLKGYSSYSYTKSIWDINCKNRTHQFLYYVDVDQKGSILYSVKFDNPRMGFIVPGSMGELFYEAVCPKN